MVFSKSQSSSSLPHRSWLACWPTRRKSLLSLISVRPSTCLNPPRKSGRSSSRMSRLRQFPSTMAFLGVCGPISPSWSAYSALYTCKVGLCLIFNDYLSIDIWVPPVSQPICLKCVRPTPDEGNPLRQSQFFTGIYWRTV